MKHRPLSLALALTLTAVVTACGGSSDAGGSDGAAPAASVR